MTESEKYKLGFSNRLQLEVGLWKRGRRGGADSPFLKISCNSKSLRQLEMAASTAGCSSNEECLRSLSNCTQGGETGEHIVNGTTAKNGY